MRGRTILLMQVSATTDASQPGTYSCANPRGKSSRAAAAVSDQLRQAPVPEQETGRAAKDDGCGNGKASKQTGGI